LKQQFNSAETFRGCPDLMSKYQFHRSTQEIYGTVLNSQNAFRKPWIELLFQAIGQNFAEITLIPKKNPCNFRMFGKTGIFFTRSGIFFSPLFYNSPQTLR